MTELATATAHWRSNHSLPAQAEWQSPPRPCPAKLAWLPVGVACATILTCMFVSGFLNNIWLSVALIAMFFAAVDLAYRARDRCICRAEPRDLTLLEDTDDPTTFLVQIHIIQDGVIVGVDRGIACFESDALVFSGHACSFCIGSQDLARTVSRSAYRLHDVGKDFSWSVVPLKWGGALGVGMMPLKVESKQDRGRASAFFAALGRFSNATPPTELDRRYPPLSGWQPDKNA